jgi:hypothetical protein
MLVRHGMSTLGSHDVMRFLGRKFSYCGAIPPRFEGEIVSDVRHRQEGVRIKHRIDHNSVKLYDKAYAPAGAVLRAETTINDPSDFKVYRTAENDPEGKLDWRQLRKGVADLHRRAEVSQRCNERYLDALASVDATTTMEELLCRITAPTTWHNKRVRALNPFASEDLLLLEAVSRGEFTINGMRNRDLQNLFFEGKPSCEQEARKRSSWVTRKLRLLRAHGLLTKVPHTHRYQLTTAGRQLATAVLTARHTPIRQLLPPELLQEAA